MESLHHRFYTSTSLPKAPLQPAQNSGVTPAHHLTIAYLKREITCLEKQLKRIRMQNKPMYSSTIATYEEMINARKAKLHTMSYREL